MADNRSQERKKHYISHKESREIAKENSKAIRYYEGRKKRRVKPEEYVTEMKDPANLVEFDDLHTFFFSDAGTVKAVNGVTFSVPAGSTVGVVGESGCGKSVTSLSLMQLVQAPSGQIVSGSIRFRADMFKLDAHGKKIPVYETEKDENGEERIKLDARGRKIIKKNELGGNMYEMQTEVVDIAKMPTEAMRTIRGREIAMIFQEPMTSLNPVFTIGNQLDEVGKLHIQGISKERVRARSIEMLKLVGIADPEGVYKKYPHELSGGMRQRVMINGSIMLITHDLGVVAEMADYVVVMYAGKVIEMGTAEDIFDRPLHPYTVGLQKSKPTVDQVADKLYCIPGFVPNPINMPNYCYFRDRCEKCMEKCSGEYPQFVQVTPTHKVACYLYNDMQSATEENKTEDETHEKPRARRKKSSGAKEEVND